LPNCLPLFQAGEQASGQGRKGGSYGDREITRDTPASNHRKYTLSHASQIIPFGPGRMCQAQNVAEEDMVVAPGSSPTEGSPCRDRGGLATCKMEGEGMGLSGVQWQSTFRQPQRGARLFPRTSACPGARPAVRPTDGPSACTLGRLPARIMLRRTVCDYAAPKGSLTLRRKGIAEWCHRHQQG